MILKRKTAKTSDTDEPADRAAAGAATTVQHPDSDSTARSPDVLQSGRNRGTGSNHKHADNNNHHSSKENGSRRTNSVDRANEIAGKEKRERQEQPDRP